ncbi:MAG: phosphomevalonate kinase [Clostridiales bacterium 38-18]|nr:MAG: phosphomevalonate kinase [Clostridiales bacterium 38-18]
MQFKVPGKLILSGEYAILYPNQIAIVAATNRTLTVAISHSDEEKSYVYSKDTDVRLYFDALGDGFIDEAIRTAMAYIRQFIKMKYHSTDLKERTVPLKIILASELSNSEKVSLGLGSSAAVIVGVIKALLEWHGFRYNKALLFKLAYLAHYRVQGSGSGVDIAAAVYGGLILYKSMDIKCMLQEANHEYLYDEKIYRIVSSKWSGGDVTPLKLPDVINCVVFWTGEKASTKDYIKRFYQVAEKDKKVINTFLMRTHENVKALEMACYNNDASAFFEAIKNQRQTLLDLEHQLGLKLESEKHTVFSEALAQIGAAKFSGAGGGDCAIGFYRSTDQVAINQILERMFEPKVPNESKVPIESKVSIESKSILETNASAEEQLFWDLIQKS